MAGWDDHRLRCGEAEIAFAAEHVGWSVSIDGPMEQEAAQRFVAAVIARVERELAAPIEWLQIT